MFTALENRLSIAYELEGYYLIDSLFKENERSNYELNSLNIEREEYAFYEWLDKEECDRSVSC